MVDNRQLTEIRWMSLSDAKEIINTLEQKFKATPFQSFAWLNVVEKELFVQLRIAVFIEQGSAVGYISFSSKRAGITINFSPPFSSETAYGGIVCESGREGELYLLLKKSCNYFVVHPSNLDIEGIVCQPKYTVLTTLDAEDADAHFKRLSKGHRYNITKAKKDNILSISEDYSMKSIKIYHDILNETYSYNGFKALPIGFYSAIISKYHKENNCKLLIARNNGKPVGTICLFIHNKTLYYWTGGFLRDVEVTKLYPNDLLQWNAILWGYERSVQTYDLLGADILGIRNFKLGFGGKLIAYTKIFSSKRIHALSKIYGKMGKLKNHFRKR